MHWRERRGRFKARPRGLQRWRGGARGLDLSFSFADSQAFDDGVIRADRRRVIGKVEEPGKFGFAGLEGNGEGGGFVGGRDSHRPIVGTDAQGR